LFPSLDRVRTYWRLGLSNLARVGLYRIGLKSGLHPVLRIAAPVAGGPFFGSRAQAPKGLKPSTRWTDKAHYFSAHDFPVDAIPDWHATPFRPGVRADASRPWHQLGDFDAELGDIKTVWEASRFEWLIPKAQRVALGDVAELIRLNAWIANWARLNPPYLGVNWKCGQEASIRVLHLAAAALILDNHAQPLTGLRDLLRAHLRRIAPTMAYAIGQQNNHGTTEAAALFVGGSWLASQGEVEAQKWAWMGRQRLSERATTLIEPDGTFSQYSVVYHRVMLDCYAFAESWRRRLDLPAFAPVLRQRLQAAVGWLYHLVDSESGDAPNLGANDGARLFPFSDAPFRDFRPSLQWASTLFCDAATFANVDDNDSILNWLGLAAPGDRLPPPQSESFDDGGFHVLRNERALAVLRYPRFRFRPSQADAMHVDLWVDGANLLRDAGTFSYNCDPADYAYFNGIEAHNSVQFDGRPQMPRISRFLLGYWLISSAVRLVTERAGAVSAGAACCDSAGATHDRQIELSADRLMCTDRLAGKAQTACLRWRLPKGDWALTANGAKGKDAEIWVEIENGNATPVLAQARESRHYLESSDIVVLELVVTLPNMVRTEIRF
jgi:Heparinase II/III-like protein/Heparinase II/III N-terminus